MQCTVISILLYFYMKLVVFSSCINEEKTIGKVLDLVPKRIKGIDKIEKLVIDDGSTDNTAKIAREKGAKVFSNGSQKHLAYSFQKAVSRALDIGADLAVNIDGDLQFNPKEISKLVEPIIKQEADFVAGDRFTDMNSSKRRKPKDMPASKYYGNILGTYIISKLSGRKFKDVTCGFRAYSREALLNLNINSKYTYTQESFQVLASKKINIKQVPVSVKYYPGRKSRVVLGVFKFITGSALNILRAFRDFAPLSFFGILSLISFSIGLGLSIFLFVHLVRTRSFTPYKFIGFGAIYFISLSLVTFLFGLLADMFDRFLNNQEKVLYQLKKLSYKNNK